MSEGWSKRIERGAADGPTRRQLLDAAEEAFGEQGFTQTPVATIAERAGVSRATFYVYFASRDEVLRELAIRFRDEVLAAQRAASRLGHGPGEVIDASLRAAMRTYATHARLLAVIEHQTLTDPEVAALWRDVLVTPEQTGAAFIEQLTSSGLANPAASATAISELIGGALIRFAAGSLHTGQDARQLEEQVIDMYRRLIGFPSTPAIPSSQATSESRHSPERVASRTTTKILDAAEVEFAKHGYAGASIVDIASVAGVSRPTLYSRFRTKYDILTGVAERVRDAFLAAQERDASTPADVLTNAARAYLLGWVRHYGVLTVIEHQAMTDPEFVRLRDDLQFRVHRRHASYLRRLREDGLAAPVVEPAVLAEVFTGAVRQFAQTVTAGRSSEIEAADKVEHLLLDLVNLRDQPTVR